MSAAASASEPWATLSQTVLPFAGIGGTLAAFIALSVTAQRRRWIQPSVFWAAAAGGAFLALGGLSLCLIWMSLGLPALVLILAIASPFVGMCRWPTFHQAAASASEGSAQLRGL